MALSFGFQEFFEFFGDCWLLVVEVVCLTWIDVEIVELTGSVWS